MNSQHSEQYKMMQPQDFNHIIEGIERALVTFESSSNHAVLRLYRQSNFAFKSTHSSAEDLLAESEHEHIFLVYLFVPVCPSHVLILNAVQFHFYSPGVCRGVDVPYRCDATNLCSGVSQVLQTKLVQTLSHPWANIARIVHEDVPTTRAIRKDVAGSFAAHL